MGLGLGLALGLGLSPVVDVTQNELLEAIRQAGTRNGSVPSGVYAVADIQRMTGWYPAKIRAALATLKAEGRLVTVTLVREAVDGRMRTVPGYRIVAKGSR